MAISAIIKQMNPAEDPRKLMLISNYKIQSKQLHVKNLQVVIFPLLASSVVSLEVSSFYSQM